MKRCLLAVLALVLLVGCGGQSRRLSASQSLQMCVSMQAGIEKLAKEHPEFPAPEARRQADEACAKGFQYVPDATPAPVVGSRGCNRLDVPPTVTRVTRLLPADGAPTIGGVKLPRGSRCFGYWATDLPVTHPEQLAAKLAAVFGQTGLWPVIWDDDREDPDGYAMLPGDPARADGLDVKGIFEQHYHGYFAQDPPFSGLAEGSLKGSPLAHVQWPRMGPRPLLLVPVRRPADVVSVAAFAQTEIIEDPQLTAVVRSWEDRFGAVVVALGPGELGVAVSAPPSPGVQAQRLALEQSIIAPDDDETVWDSAEHLDQLISTGADNDEGIRSRHLWYFGWPDRSGCLENRSRRVGQKHPMALPSLTAPQHFKPSPRFSLGVEEELHVVHPVSLLPCGGTDELLARVVDDSITGEVSDGVIELRTPVCDSAGEAIAVLGGLRKRVSAHARLIGAGVHPAGRFGDVRLREGERYELIGESMGALIRQTPHCGVHVHVGMPDGETAVRACNGMRAWIPLLQALAANSPYWYGRDSGLASTRAVICNSFPRGGVPRAFTGYADFAATVDELCALGECPDYSFLWWDLRPHPNLGTLEIRACDAQSSPEDLAAIVALTHCLAVHEANEPSTAPGPEALRELCFRATRDGLDARLALEGSLRPLREVAYRAIALAGAYAADLGCWDELMLVHRLLERGNGAIRQREAATAGGVRLMLRRLADETVNPRALQLVAT